MNSLNFSYDRNIEAAYIITLKNNSSSEEMSKRCQESCTKVKLPYKVWYAYDGTSGRIVEPEHLKSIFYMSWFKNFNKNLTLTEVCCSLSHISLWCHCIEIDKPIVILEHDAIMLKEFKEHPLYNSIVYLGNVRQYKDKWPVLVTPTHLSTGNNLHFLAQSHAYAIDPPVAKNLVSHVLKFGIHEALDCMIRTDLFNISQFGLCAYDENTSSTVVKKKY